MKKIIFLLIFLCLPLVSATEDCGLLNLATCIPQKIFEFLIYLLNAPLAPLLTLVQSLLTEPVDISLFGSIWAIMIYILSLFYGFLMLYSGFNFMFSGHDAVRREKAKEWFRNTIIMIVLIQASYFLYSLVIDISSLVTNATINLISQTFFQLTIDNIVNVGLQFFFALFYVLILFLSALILTIRYLIVAFGVALLPFGIFFYFVPPLKSYGKLILNFLGVCIFVTFFDAVIFLVSSKLLTIPIFASMKILVMISAFSIANILMLYLMFFSIIKSALEATNGATGAIILATKYFASP